MKTPIFIFVLLSFFANAQKVDNSFHGFYQEKKDNTFYKQFEFDGNGKVLIAGLDYGDFFTRNDSIIVYPDKSLFIFKIQKNKTIKGISDWVEKGIWEPIKDSIVTNNRKNEQQAQREAQLLAEYYDRTKAKSSLEDLFSGKTNPVYQEMCDKGLSRSCMNLFGMKMLEYTPALLNEPEKIASKKLKPHPELIALSKKIVALGNPEGYTVLGSYYHILGLKEKANSEWDKAIKLGSRKASMAKGLIEFGKSLEE
ncbi:hypothetical protein [Chryseobacterium sp.]|uniref:hypothetical protein n=1 Tax=Chryseobacterium sp. TaxID=1871047 RepID=UPI00388E2023